MIWQQLISYLTSYIPSLFQTDDDEKKKDGIRGQVFLEFLLLLAITSTFATLLIMGVGNVFGVIWKSIVGMVVESPVTLR